jgi:hypothetical protein
MLAGVLLVLVATYVIAVRSRFKGPKVDLAMLER